jgi:hypothetical protein
MTAPFGSRTKKRLDDFRSGGDGALVNRVDVVDLDRDVWMNVCVDVQLHHAQLHLGLVGAEEKDPVETLATRQSDHVVVERPALVEAIGEDVRLDALVGGAGRPLLIAERARGASLVVSWGADHPLSVHLQQRRSTQSVFVSMAR